MIKSVYKVVKSGDIIIYTGKTEATKLHKAYYKGKLTGSQLLSITYKYLHHWRVKDFDVSEYTTPKHDPFTSAGELLEFLVAEEGYSYI